MKMEHIKKRKTAEEIKELLWAKKPILKGKGTP
jgi:hypothetical protein